MAANSASVRTRIPPSPTGRMHIGTVRTALYNFLYARQHGGTYIARIEDTDRERSKEEYVTAIWEDLAWLGLEPDEKYRQSERLENHQAAMQKLLDSDAAYVSKEEAKDGSGREVEVVRLRNPGTEIRFQDEVRGEVSFDTSELGDFVIARSLDEPLYHLAVVVDDAEMGITHVIRGEDHISNTPRQILIQEALGYERPVYAHLPLILAPDRAKLSKRKHSAGIDYFREEGFLPEALINYLALLGWNPGTDRELFTLDELIEAFSLEHVHKAGAVFNTEKLRWFNREYLQQKPPEEVLGEIADILQAQYEQKGIVPEAETLARASSIIQERVSVWSDVRQMVVAGETDFFFMKPSLAASSLVPKKGTTEETAAHLKQLTTMLKDANEDVFAEPETLKAHVWGYAEEAGRGAVLWPMRYALTGLERSPDPFSVAWAIGRDETIVRLESAADVLVS